MARPELRQVKQRVSRHVRLEPLGIAELSQYIDHRLAVARDGATATWRGDVCARGVVGDLAAVGRHAAGDQPAVRSRARGRVRTAGAIRRCAARRGGSDRTGHSPRHAGRGRAAGARAADGRPRQSSPRRSPWPAPDELPVVLGDARDLEPPARAKSRVLVIAGGGRGPRRGCVVCGAWIYRDRHRPIRASPRRRRPRLNAGRRRPPPRRPTRASAPAPGPPAAAPPVSPPAPSTTPAAPGRPRRSPAGDACRGRVNVAGRTDCRPLHTGPFEIVVASFRTMTRATGSCS